MGKGPLSQGIHTRQVTYWFAGNHLEMAVELPSVDFFVSAGGEIDPRATEQSGYYEYDFHTGFFAKIEFSHYL